MTQLTLFEMHTLRRRMHRRQRMRFDSKPRMTQLDLFARSIRDCPMAFGEIAWRMRLTETNAKWIYSVAIKKLQRECERAGITVEDAIGGMCG